MDDLFPSQEGFRINPGTESYPELLENAYTSHLSAMRAHWIECTFSKPEVFWLAFFLPLYQKWLMDEERRVQ